MTGRWHTFVLEGTILDKHRQRLRHYIVRLSFDRINLRGDRVHHGVALCLGAWWNAERQRELEREDMLASLNDYAPFRLLLWVGTRNAMERGHGTEEAEFALVRAKRACT